MAIRKFFETLLLNQETSLCLLKLIPEAFKVPGSDV